MSGFDDRGKELRLTLVKALRWKASMVGTTPALAEMLGSAADRIEALESEAQQLVQELNRASLNLASERARRIDAELERERFRVRLAEGRPN